MNYNFEVTSHIMQYYNLPESQGSCSQATWQYPNNTNWYNIYDYIHKSI